MIAVSWLDLSFFSGDVSGVHLARAAHLFPGSARCAGSIFAQAVELRGSVEQILLARDPGLFRRGLVAHTIDRIASHLARAQFLLITTVVRREPQFDEATNRLRQGGAVVLMSHPRPDGLQQRR